MTRQESDISLVNDDEDVMALLVDSRLGIAESLFQQAAYSDAVVAYEAALALAPDNEAAAAGLKQSRVYASNPPAAPSGATGGESTPEEPQPSNNLHTEQAESDDGSNAHGIPGASPDEMEVEFHKPGSIGILFEAASEYAPITIGEVKEASQAAERNELVRGLALLEVQGKSIKGLKFEQALELLTNKQRPLRLKFSREPMPSPPASPSPSVPALELQTPAADTPNPSMRTTRDNETPYTREQRDWEGAVRAFNSNSKKGVKYMVEVGLVPHTPEGIARMLRDEDRRGLSKQEIGEYLSGGKPEEQEFREAVRTAYLAFADFRGWSFVAALRSFLQGFRLPGESMLIERIIFSFATRFYEQNPGYCVHLTDEKIGALQADFVETSGGEPGIGIHLVTSLFKSIASSFKYMKDAEVYAMMEITPNELVHTYKLLEIDAQPPEELNRTAETLRLATALMKLESEAQVARSQADSAAVAAEQTAVLAAQAHDDERLQLGRDAADRGLEAEYAETVAKSAERAAADALERFQKLAPGFRVDLPMFLTMVARKLGTDTMFVLAYSVIMLNTDAHNPRLKTERISKAQFIENNKRSPDLAAISEVIMASLYDEIVSKEIKLKDEDAADMEESVAESDTSVAGGTSPAGYLRRLSFIGGEEQTAAKPDFDPADVGQQLYAVQQTGLKGLPRKVKVGLTGMGISVFDSKGRPLTNLLYQTMVKWGVDVSQSQKVLGLRVLMDEATGDLEIFFKTPEGETLCTKLSAHQLAMKKAARLREREMETLRASQHELSTSSVEVDEIDVSEPELQEEPPLPSASAAPTEAAAAATVDEIIDHSAAVSTVPTRAPLGPLALRAGLNSEMDASLRAATLSVQRAYVTVAASAAGVDGAEVPRCGREAYIALYRVYSLQPAPYVAVSAEPESPVVQIPVPPIEAAQLPAPEPSAVLAEPEPTSSDPQLVEDDNHGLSAVLAEPEPTSSAPQPIEDDDGNATATSGTDSEEDAVLPGPEEQSWEKAAMELQADPTDASGAEVAAGTTTREGGNEQNTRQKEATEKSAVAGASEPQLSTYYSESRPTASLHSYYGKSPSATESPRAVAPMESPCAAVVQSEFGSDIRRRVQLTRAFTQLRDELGDDGALEVVDEVYTEVSPQRFADTQPEEQQRQPEEDEQKQEEQQKQTRTLTTPDKPPYEPSEDGKEILF